MWPLVQGAESIDRAVCSSSEFSNLFLVTGLRNCCSTTGVQMFHPNVNRCSPVGQQQLMKQECSYGCKAGLCLQRHSCQPRAQNCQRTSPPAGAGASLPHRCALQHCRLFSEPDSAIKHPQKRGWKWTQTLAIATSGSSMRHQKSWDIFIQIYLLIR